MPPAAPDDLIRQRLSLEDESAITPTLSVPTHTIQEHEPSGKSKKKKNGKKNKGAKATPEAPPEDLIPAISRPEEPHTYPEPDPTLEYPLGDPDAVQDPEAVPHDYQNHRAQLTAALPDLDAPRSVEEAADNALTTRTDTWAQEVPYGKSPPADLMDGDLPSESPLNFPTIPDRAGFSQPSSASPPAQIRPFSYGGGYRSNLHSRQQSVDRRKSHSYGSPMSNVAPPPHLPQAHFYGAPDIDLPLQNRPGDGAYSFCGFDTLPSMSAKALRGGMNVLVVGIDSAIDVFAIEDRRTRLIGKINGLNGRVLEAKILSPPLETDSATSSQPHVALILHGPLPPSEEEGRVSATGSDMNEVAPSMKRDNSSDKRPVRCETRFYQTRVEIYSLRSGEHLTTLFASKPMPSPESIPGLPSLAPAPAGSLKLYSSGNYVIVASGSSGEVFVYKSTSSDGYLCLGKTWTSVQIGETRRYSTSSSSTDADGSHADSPRAFATERPILAVQGRWLAIVPPVSHRASIQGSVPAHLLHPKAQGMETRGPPTVPSVNCATDAGDGESILDKVARGVTQELVKGARWMGDQGLQAWNNYWNTGQSSSPSTPPLRPIRGSDSPGQGYGLFPPTHGQDTQATSSPEPDAVSIIDLKRFDEGVEAKAISLNPVATFQVPNGCSFLSLSPNGLVLFTASKKGDVQYVWDLMQLKHCRAMAFITEELAGHGSNVRQIARYARLTTSSIVDVIWTGPVGERLAVITRKGTIHVFDLPRSAFQWPPFRRARASSKKSPKVDPVSDELSGPATVANPLSAAMNFVGGKTQPFLSAVRGRVQSTGGGFPHVSGFALPTAVSIKGGKVVAAGLSKSVGAAASGTVQTLRHVGENRLHLAGLARDPAPSRVTWMMNKGHIFLGVVDDGQFKLYRLKRSTSTSKNRQSYSVIGSKEVQFRLPGCMQSICGPAPLVPYDPERVIEAFLLLPSASSQPIHSGTTVCQPLSQAEIETNTPYQPFHTDQRVSLCVYPRDSKAQMPSGQWVFGDDIPTTKVHVRSYSTSSDDRELGVDEDAAIRGDSFGAGGEMENLITLGNSTGNIEEVIITTRRKKKKSTAFKADDGFFEDDCEVLDFARDRV